MSLDLTQFKPSQPDSNTGTQLDFSKFSPSKTGQNRDWQNIIRSIASKMKVDPNQAIQLSRFESSLNPYAYRSDTDVRGLFQVRSDKGVGVKGGSEFYRTINGVKYDLRDPEQNITAGLQLWKTALSQNKNDPNLAYRKGYNPGFTGKGPFDISSAPAHLPQAQAGTLNLKPGTLTGGVSSTGPTSIRAPKPTDRAATNLADKLFGGAFSTVQGVVKGLTGLHFEADPTAMAQYERELSGQPTKPIQGPLHAPVPYSTISKPAEWGTYIYGVGKVTGLIRAGAIKLAPTLIGRTVTTVLNKLPIKNQVRLLTPLALGMGTVAGTQNAVQQIYNKGYLDPKVVGEEAAFNAGMTYLLPEASVLFANATSASVKLAPQLMRFLPPSIGGLSNPFAGLPRQVVSQSVREFKPLSLPITLWQGAAKGLQDFYKTTGKTNPAIQDKLTGLRTLGRWMDGFLRSESDYWQFPSHRGWEMPVNSPLNPTNIFMSLNRERNWVQYSLGSRRFTGPNIGGGLGGQITNNIFAKQLEDLYLALKGSNNPVDKKGAWYALSAAKRIRRIGGRWSPSQLDQITNSLRNVINLPRFRTQVTDAYGNKLSSPSEEGDFLIFMKDLYSLHRRQTSPEQLGSGLLRTWTNHALLGMGNIASALTVLNRLSFPLATEGAENVTAALREVQSNSKFYNDMIRVLGLSHPYTTLGQVQTTKLADLSFGFYDWAEKRALPAAAMARFFNLARKGIPYKEAFLEAQKYATQLRTSMDWDLSPLLRNSSRIGPAVRLMFQFFPFAGKSASMAGGMGLDEFTKYASYMFSFAGIKGVPGAVVADRILTAYMGHSIMNHALSNPAFQKILYGLPGMTLGVDIGSRHNWTNSLMDKVLGMSKPAFLNYAQNVGNSYWNLMQNPTGINLVRAFGNTVLGLGQFVTALDAEKHGAILDRSGYPLVKPVTPTELGQRALGFTPVRMSQEEAFRAEKGALTSERSKQLANEYQSFRVAWLDHNPAGMKQAIARIRKIDPSISAESLISQLTREAMPTRTRDIMTVPKWIRRQLLQR